MHIPSVLSPHFCRLCAYLYLAVRCIGHASHTVIFPSSQYRFSRQSILPCLSLPKHRDSSWHSIWTMSAPCAACLRGPICDCYAYLSKSTSCRLAVGLIHLLQCLPSPAIQDNSFREQYCTIVDRWRCIQLRIYRHAVESTPPDKTTSW